MTIAEQIIALFILAIPVACITWTVTHEEAFREPRDYCIKNSIEKKTLLARKFFYLFTCEYCFSHYVVLMVLFVTGYKLLFTDWRGYPIAFFSLVWVANIYMSLYALLRTTLKEQSTEISFLKEKIESLIDS